MKHFIYKYTITSLIKSDAFVGNPTHTRSYTNKQFIYEGNNNLDTIDLSYTYNTLKKLLNLTTELVALKNNFKAYIPKTPNINPKLNKYFIQTNWISGTISNYKELKHHSHTKNNSLPAFIALFNTQTKDYNTITKELIKWSVPFILITNTDAHTIQSPYALPINLTSPKVYELLNNLITQAILRGIIKETLKLKTKTLKLPRLDLNQRPVD